MFFYKIRKIYKGYNLINIMKEKRFGCVIDCEILKEFRKTFTYEDQEKGDTIRAFIEKSMKDRIKDFKKK